MDPNTAQAEQFAHMLLAGVPALQAVAYFFPEGTDEEILRKASRYWPTQKVVAEALTKLQGGNWLKLKPEERIKLALDKQYNDMAWFLYTHNYGDLEGPKRAKADTARETLERKLAGLAGQLDPLAKFYEDLVTQRVKKSAVSLPAAIPS